MPNGCVSILCILSCVYYLVYICNVSVLSHMGLRAKNYSTQYSHAVTHHSTDCAIIGLTSGIGRDPVFSNVYGRRYRSWCWDEFILKFH